MGGKKERLRALRTGGGGGQGESYDSVTCIFAVSCNNYHQYCTLSKSPDVGKSLILTCLICQNYEKIRPWRTHTGRCLLCVSVYDYVCVYIVVCVARARVCFINTYKHSYIHKDTYVSVCVSVRVCIRAYACACTCVYICVYVMRCNAHPMAT